MRISFSSLFSGKKNFNLEDCNLHVGKIDVHKVGELQYCVETTQLPWEAIILTCP